jgi:hypothetical protein
MTKAQNPSTPPVCDAITLELITGALGMAVTEMATLLERTAMSPFIREKKDFHVALADAEGKVIVASGGATGEFMSTVFERFPAEEMGPGDIYWYNDCYGSRGIVSHSPDQVFVAPVYFEGKLIGFSQCWAHFNDIGGMHPGTISPDATSIYQESSCRWCGCSIADTAMTICSICSSVTVATRRWCAAISGRPSRRWRSANGDWPSCSRGSAQMSRRPGWISRSNAPRLC